MEASLNHPDANVIRRLVCGDGVTPSPVHVTASAGIRSRSVGNRGPSPLLKLKTPLVYDVFSYLFHQLQHAASALQ